MQQDSDPGKPGIDSQVISSPAEKPVGMARSSIIVSCMTFLSRVLGLIREIIFAALFGDGAAADAFFVAFKIPNFLRRLFAEGAFSQAFVPVLAEFKKHRSATDVKLFIDHVAGSLSQILLIITVAGVLAAPLLAGLFAPGYLDDQDKFALLVSMLRITFPYILLISLTGFAGGILNSYGRFSVPALTPVFLNLSLIGCALLLSPVLSVPSMALAWGVLLAGFIQLTFQIPFLVHLGLLPRPRINYQHEGVRKVMLLMLPVLFSVSVGQINLLIDTILATWIEGDGSVSWLYYSDRLMELPLGIFGIAIATVILPGLSKIHADNNTMEFERTLDWGLRCILVIGIPASLALIVLADPLIVTLYQRGEFGADSVSPTSNSLQAYALGLTAFMAIKILASGYFSRHDTTTPVRFGVIAMISNIALNFALITSLAHIGLALATSIAAFVNAGLLLGGLIKQQVFKFNRHWWLFLGRLLVANAVMVYCLWSINDTLAVWLDRDTLGRIWNLTILIAAGILSYALVLLGMGMRPADFRH